MPKPKNNVRALKPPPPLNSEEPAAKSNSEIEQQLELELCWCIQQLQTALRIGKLNSKQGWELAPYFLYGKGCKEHLFQSKTIEKL